MAKDQLNNICVHAGERAMASIKAHGLQAQHIGAVAAAAGGPKGLSLLALDQFIFGQWLASAPRPRQLYGASIGAWRMAAASRHDRADALTRFGQAYLERQRYTQKPSSQEVAQRCRDVVKGLLIDAHSFAAKQDPLYQLNAIVARSLSPTLDQNPLQSIKPFFATAALKNTFRRRYLGQHLQRWVFQSGPTKALNIFDPRDGFDTQFCELTTHNFEDALLASGTIPMVCDPVRNIANTPNGTYWDGGLIDYHLYLPFNRLPDLVLYPHFSSTVTAGWLDKFLPWRKHGVGKQGSNWFSNVVLVSPSAALLAKLPNGKLPDRNDFYSYGIDHDRRIKDWTTAMNQCQAMVDDLALFCQTPDRYFISPLAQ